MHEAVGRRHNRFGVFFDRENRENFALSQAASSLHRLSGRVFAARVGASFAQQQEPHYSLEQLKKEKQLVAQKLKENPASEQMAKVVFAVKWASLIQLGFRK